MQPLQQPHINILLADDDKDDRFLFEKALKDIAVAFQLTTVSDGERLMDHLLNRSVSLPDVIFIDLNMPRKNGSECLVIIKQNEKLKHIPVIIYSTSLHDVIAELLYQNGAHYYLQKCDFPDLKKSLPVIFTLLNQDPGKPSRAEFTINLKEQ